MIVPGHSYPGARPLDDGLESLAAAALDVFLGDVREKAGELDQVTVRHRTAEWDGAPVRTKDADRDGWFGWSLPMSDGASVLVLIPGVELARMREEQSSDAPCLYVRDSPWGWSTAVGMVAAEGTQIRLGS